MKLINLNHFDQLNNFPKYQDLNIGYTIFEDVKLEEVLAISHRWEQPENPDPSRQQFAEVLNYLRLNPKPFVFYDYSLLPQKPRSLNEDKIFKEDLKQINKLFKSCETLILNEGSTDYHTRAWCFFEWSLSFGNHRGNTRLFRNMQHSMIKDDSFRKNLESPDEWHVRKVLSILEELKYKNFRELYLSNIDNPRIICSLNDKASLLYILLLSLSIVSPMALVFSVLAEYNNMGVEDLVILIWITIILPLLFFINRRRIFLKLLLTQVKSNHYDNETFKSTLYKAIYNKVFLNRMKQLNFLSCLSVTNGSDLKYLMMNFMSEFKISKEELRDNYRHKLDLLV